MQNCTLPPHYVGSTHLRNPSLLRMWRGLMGLQSKDSFPFFVVGNLLPFWTVAAARHPSGHLFPNLFRALRAGSSWRQSGVGNLSSPWTGTASCSAAISLVSRVSLDVPLQVPEDTLATWGVSLSSRWPCANCPPAPNPHGTSVPERGSPPPRSTFFHFLFSKCGDLHQVRVKLTNREQKETFSWLWHWHRGEEEELSKLPFNKSSSAKKNYGWTRNVLDLVGQHQFPLPKSTQQFFEELLLYWMQSRGLWTMALSSPN